MQAIDRIAPIMPTTPARMTHDYVRCGTTSLFAAFDIASGSVIAQHYRRYRHQEFLRFLKLINGAVPKDLDLYLVLLERLAHCGRTEHRQVLRARILLAVADGEPNAGIARRLVVHEDTIRNPWRP